MPSVYYHHPPTPFFPAFCNEMMTAEMMCVCRRIPTSSWAREPHNPNTLYSWQCWHQHTPGLYCSPDRAWPVDPPSLHPQRRVSLRDSEESSACVVNNRVRYSKILRCRRKLQCDLSRTMVIDSCSERGRMTSRWRVRHSKPKKKAGGVGNCAKTCLSADGAPVYNKKGAYRNQRNAFGR